MRRLHHRPSYANVMATVAVVIAVGLTPAGAHVTKSVDHLFNKHIKPKLTRPGTINKAGNPVDWTKLKGVPAGLADGDDEVGPSNTLYGRAKAEENLTLLVTWLEMGLQVRTGDTEVPDKVYEVRIINTNPPGGARFKVLSGDGLATVEPGGSATFGNLFGLDALVVENGGSGRMVKLNCLPNVQLAGDDGFMQCMAHTAGP